MEEAGQKVEVREDGLILGMREGMTLMPLKLCKRARVVATQGGEGKNCSYGDTLLSRRQLIKCSPVPSSAHGSNLKISLLDV